MSTPDTLRNIVEAPFVPAANQLACLADAAKRMDDLAYRDSLRILIENVLLELEKELITNLSLWNRPQRKKGERRRKKIGKIHFFLSLHFESAILHDRIRTLSASGNWGLWTDRSATELKHFQDFFSLDPRQGHLLTDPSIKEELLHVVFQGKKVQTNTLPAIVVPQTAWDKAYHMLDSLNFLVLLGLLPDSAVCADHFSRDIASLHSEIPEKIRYPVPAKPADPIDAELKKQQVRSFLLTFYFSIATWANANVRDQRVLIWPFHDSSFLQNWTIDKDGNAVANDVVPMLGSLALVILGAKENTAGLPALTEDATTMLQATGRLFVELLQRFELDGCILIPAIASLASDEEDRIRTACHFPLDPENRKPLSDLCKPLYDKIRELVDPDVAEHDNTFKDFLHECKLVGASRQMVDLVQQLHIAAQNAKINRATSIFMYGEPGTGKERLAKLLHLFSKRSHSKTIKDDWAKQQSTSCKQDIEAARYMVKRWHATHCLAADDTPHPMTDFFTEAGDDLSCVDTAQRENRLFNYFALNCATLHDSEAFRLGLFGDYSGGDFVVGRMLAAHLLCGTLFLDELNTLPDRNCLNVFLRLLEKPYEMELRGREGGPLVGTNVLLICASNRSREQLVKDDFNDAVIYRLTQRYFEIPPLRERRVDIAIFVNSEIRTFSEKHTTYAIRRIDPNAMRLICDLPWPENYRGVAGLLDHVLEDRLQRKLKDTVLTFDAVVTGVRRREILRRVDRR